MLLAHGRGFVEDRVESSIVLLVLLDEVQIPAVFIDHAGDPQRGQKPKLKHPIAGDPWFKRN